MKIKNLFIALLTITALPFTAFTPIDPTPFQGTWIRQDDHLKIEIDNDHAAIVQEGNEKFPCDVSSLLIYKDIREDKPKHWTCKFLVVTMGSCITGYETGQILLDKSNNLIIICPGYKSKIYQKAKPRFESSNK